MAGEVVYGIPIDTPQWGLADPQQPVQQTTVQSRDLPTQQVAMQPVQRDIARSNNNYNPTGTYEYGQQTGILPPINHAQPFTNLTHMVSPYTGQVFNLTGYPSKYPHMIFGDLFDTTAPYMNAVLPWLLTMSQQIAQQGGAASGAKAGDTGSSKKSDTKAADTTKKLAEPLPVPLASTRNPVTVPTPQAPPLAVSHAPVVQMAPSHTTTAVPDVSRFAGPTSVSHHNGTTITGVPTGPTQAGRMLITPPAQAEVEVDPSTTGLLEAAGIVPPGSLLDVAGVTTPGSLVEAAGIASTQAKPTVPMASSRQRMTAAPTTGATTRRTSAPTVSNSRTQAPQSLVEAAGVSTTTPEGVYLLGNGQGMTRDGNVVIVQQDALTGQYQYFDLSGNPIALF